MLKIVRIPVSMGQWAVMVVKIFVFFVLVIVPKSSCAVGVADRVLNLKVSSGGDERCKIHIGAFTQSLRNGDSWANNSKYRQKDQRSLTSSFALSVFSSFANFDKTYSHGNSFDFGDFDRCLDVKHNNSELIIGKYCLVQYYSTRNDIKAIPPGKLLFETLPAFIILLLQQTACTIEAGETWTPEQLEQFAFLHHVRLKQFLQ